MKNILLSLILTACYLLLATFVWAINFPKPAGFVNDFANIYSAQFKNELENNLSEFEKATGAEIAVVTIKSLEGNDIDDYAVRLFENWKIGKKGKDNGLLLLISQNDRKIRIEVGYGLEPYINDGRAGDIIRNVISPAFKAGDFEKGTFTAVDQLKTYIANKDIAPTVPAGKFQVNDSMGGLIALGFIIIYALATYLASYLGRTKEIWPGGAIGAVLGGLGGIFIASLLGLIIGVILFGSLGLFLDWILTKNYQVRKARGLPTGFWTTWGGFGGKGGGWGGGGGFGGFGGGSSGGGGASGGW